MSERVAKMATMAAEAATAQRQYRQARQIATRWLDEVEGVEVGVVLLAATLVQAVAGQEIGQHNGMTPGEIMTALGSDMAMLANIVGDEP